MRKVNPFEEKRSVSTEDTFLNWKEIFISPYDKDKMSPYTKMRILLSKAIKYDSIWFLHNFNTYCNNNELRREIAMIRRHDFQNLSMLSNLKPSNENHLENTIILEQLEVDLTAILAQRTGDDNVRNALNFALLEDLDHLYRFSNLMEFENNNSVKNITKEYIEILPGRPTISQHRHPRDSVNKFICNGSSDNFTILAINLITALERYAMNYYLSNKNIANSDLDKKIYTEISIIEEEHLSEYESLLDTNCTYLENLVMHKYCECYLYYSFYQDEKDDRIKNIFEKLYLQECGNLKKSAEMIDKFEGRDCSYMFPDGGYFPELLKFENNIEYIRHVIKNTIYFTKDRESYIDVRTLSESSNFKKYNKQINGDASDEPCHILMEKYFEKNKIDYRYQLFDHPSNELNNRKIDNINLGR